MINCFQSLVTIVTCCAPTLSTATAYSERSAWRRQVITTHHQDLRARCAGGGGGGSGGGGGGDGGGEDGGDARAATTGGDDVDVGMMPVAAEDTAWQAAVKEEGRLQDYAEAAEEVGNRAWVITALHWCMKELDGFIWGGGAVEAEIKSARGVYFHQHGDRMPHELEAAKRDELRVAMASLAGDAGNKPILIDVGSCWHGLTLVPPFQLVSLSTPWAARGPLTLVSPCSAA